MKQKVTIESFHAWFPWVGLLAITVIRFLFLESNDVAMDEPFTVFNAQADLHTLFGIFPTENNPPLYFLLMHFWVMVFGISPFAIRFLSCIFSILTAVMLYKTGKTFFSRQVGFFAAAIFTLSDYHQLFAHEARVYALFGLLTVTSMYLFLSLSSGKGRWKYMLLLSLVNVLLIYAHFFGFFIFLIQGLSSFFIGEYRRTTLKWFAGAAALSLIAYIPYFPILFSRFFQSAGQGTWVQPPVISDLYTMVWRYLNAPVVTVMVLCILAGAAVIYVLRRVKGTVHASPANIAVIVWFTVPYLLMFLVSYRIPMFLDRYTVFISVGFYLLVAIALSSMVRQVKPLIIVMAVFLAIMAVTFHPKVYNKRRLKEAVSYISANQGPGTSVIVSPSWLSLGFAYHHNQRMFKDYQNLPLLLNKESVFPANKLKDLDTNKLGESDRVLLFEEWLSLTDPGQTTINYLNRKFRHERTTSFYQNFNVHEYKK
ncbi:MAG: glycosyltransferase family 39 protein [Bacteroidales bacterium]